MEGVPLKDANGVMGQIIERFDRVVQPTYDRTPMVITKGKGSWIWDLSGRRYLDFFPGWGVGALGHCHPRVAQALRDQAGKILHVPNNYYTVVQGKLAARLVEASFPGKVFFANSGAEANEAAVKLARRWGSPKRFEVITQSGSFHGRTLAMASATGQSRVGAGFEPLPEGFVQVPYGDLEAIRHSIRPSTVAVLVELIQGEGGIRVADPKWVRQLRKLCYEKNLLLIADEVQSGMGRTGKLFSWQHYKITPDIMTLAKSLGGGFPIGAMVAGSEVADTLGPGTHGSTFGGNPLACRAGLAVLNAISREGLLARTEEMGSYLRRGLEVLGMKFPFFVEVRGKGLMLGVELDRPGDGIVTRAREMGLLINCTQERVLRIMPAMVVTRRQIDLALGILEKALAGEHK